MQVTTPAPLREHERPMSWARAVVIAVGFFFITAILAAQLPSYIFTISTLSTLSLFEQGTLDLGLLAVGFGVISLAVVFLYDPKPLIPWPLFAAVGLAFSVVGAYMDWQVWIGIHGSNPITGQPGWGEYLTTAITQNKTTTYWPIPGQPYLFNEAWFQAGSIDLSAVGMIALLIGLGLFIVAVLNPFVLRGRLTGPLPSLLIRFCIGLGIVIVALYLTVQTFADPISNFFNVRGIDVNGNINWVPGPAVDILLFIALALVMFALLLWLLPVMVANRQHFMPPVYLHGVVGLLGTVAVPLLIIWAAVYPLINWVHGWDSQENFVQCSQKTEIPSSCTFTPYTGYIICTIVFSLTFGLLFLGLYFWSTRRDTVVLGGTIGLVFLAIAVTVIHVNDPAQTPMGLIIATGIAVLAFSWTWSTQREFASTQVEQLGCVGQWLVLGTLLLIYLFGFAVFSMPSFFETEALALFYQPGPGNLHDAFWAALIMGGLAALQFVFLVRRRPMSNLRKFAMWVMLVAGVLEIIGAIQGFHDNVLQTGINGMEGSDAVFVTGICFGIVGVLVALYGAVRARGALSFWPVAIVVMVGISAGFGVVVYNFSGPYPELIVFAFILAMVGALAYTAAGPDEFPPEEAESAILGAAGTSE
ncbi:MAG: hypothetical protein ACLQUY_14905 [Ktedonobacterales bacterium]